MGEGPASESKGDGDSWKGSRNQKYFHCLCSRTKWRKSVVWHLLPLSCGGGLKRPRQVWPDDALGRKNIWFVSVFRCPVMPWLSQGLGVELYDLKQHVHHTELQSVSPVSYGTDRQRLLYLLYIIRLPFPSFPLQHCAARTAQQLSFS